ncbi:hypothetical protein BEL04_21155 [Mucilaginibacter sp. PPCGB 2223]|uniref:energy transducer TonB n=1 Tax=Mucilaginibacter sp. PPCGB 2223 TaxID=1886027 RepID=UPI0008250414|nr:energy transducer TonB [Mucilaginibacter sp. PPCGB 2223]OCX51213.1 hypothetical protein BEL04_21155 [Mucilaginibacter sp. PPCGB 2223]
MKNDGRHVNSKDSADYIRIVSEPDSGTTLYNIKEYYTSGKLKFISKTSKIDPPVYKGQGVEFYPTGNRKEVAVYKGGKTDGNDFEYYPNGKLYRATWYPAPKATDPHFRTDYKIMANNDSTGKHMLVDGNGYYIGYRDDFKKIEEEGNLKGGLRDGDWKGTEPNKITFIEKYDNGKLLSGQAADSTGAVVNYTQRRIEPAFNGGEDAFDNFLVENIRYPVNARRNNVQGKVFIRFLVEKDGRLTSFKVLNNGGSDELAQEALRVLKKSPKWKPGIFYGRAVVVEYTVPLNFALSD